MISMKHSQSINRKIAITKVIYNNPFAHIWNHFPVYSTPFFPSTQSCVHQPELKPIWKVAVDTFSRQIDLCNSHFLARISVCTLRRQWFRQQLKKSVSKRLNDQAQSSIKYHFLLYANSKGFNSLSIINVDEQIKMPFTKSSQK